MWKAAYLIYFSFCFALPGTGKKSVFRRCCYLPEETSCAMSKGIGSLKQDVLSWP